MTREGMSIIYKYNDSGIRTEKTVNGVTTKYHLVDDKVTYETNGTDSIYYLYDGNGDLYGMKLNGQNYFYVKNIQGDIIGILDTNGSRVVTYTYDTWGKVVSTTGSLASTVGEINPYRYRGYRYDNETGLYYLQSRYYNPEWGRFISPDAVAILELSALTGNALGTNLFAYCENNPIMNIDPTGYWKIPTSSLGKILLFVGINPAAAALIGIGVYKLKMLLTAKFTLFIAKLGAFWGPVVQGALVAAAAVTGIFILGPIAVGFFDAIVQRKKGVEIKLKKTWFGMPYGIEVGTY